MPKERGEDKLSSQRVRDQEVVGQKHHLSPQITCRAVLIRSVKIRYFCHKTLKHSTFCNITLLCLNVESRQNQNMLGVPIWHFIILCNDVIYDKVSDVVES